MAGSTNTVRIAVARREPGVIEGCVEPIGRVVASCASSRESRGHVIWIVRSRVIALVTAIAVGWNGCVVVVHVTARACNARVRAGQREASVVVIERRRRPSCSVVANVALLRESYGCVIRIVRVLEIRQMTRHAGGIGQLVIAAGMALAALDRRMGAGKGPAGRGVIKRSRIPVVGAMTQLARLRKSERDVTRVVRVLVILQVAADAGGGSKVVIAVGMTLRALRAGMRAGERESRLGVIEGRWLPG